MTLLELLAPAKDAETGRAAIDAGADAVYIGAPRFGAREKAGNAVADIAALADYAHRFWARVYITVNTLLHDNELPQAARLIEELHAANVDAIIIQDMGLLECALPPIPLIASTQTHNATPEKLIFLEKMGFHRAILARELTLEEIAALHAATPGIELECFVHGALCVGYSGQCYLSYALGGRSGNRGECAQPCRKAYTLTDASGKKLPAGAHPLCLRDLCLVNDLDALLDAGVTSFKIEGRLKDRAYVVNAVAAYRARLDAIIAAHPEKWRKASSGSVRTDFTPDLEKTFHRGYSTYFLHGRGAPIGAPDSPKMIGERIGTVKAIANGRLQLDTPRVPLHPGDGICFFDANHTLDGTLVNAAEGPWITPESLDNIARGTTLFRNRDHRFLKQLDKAALERRIAMRIHLRREDGQWTLHTEDEDNQHAQYPLPANLDPANNAAQAAETFRKQLSKTGDSLFRCDEVTLPAEPLPFLPVAAINACRRALLDTLLDTRERNRPRIPRKPPQADARYPETHLSFEGNVLNAHADRFYRNHGVTVIEPGAETGHDLRGARVMTTRYCIKHQHGWCPRQRGGAPLQEPLYLTDDMGNRLRLEFDCAHCLMMVYHDPE